MAGGGQVQVKDVKVKVEDFTWCYRQTRWPNMTGVAAFPLPPSPRHLAPLGLDASAILGLTPRQARGWGRQW